MPMKRIPTGRDREKFIIDINQSHRPFCVAFVNSYSENVWVLCVLPQLLSTERCGDNEA